MTDKIHFEIINIQNNLNEIIIMLNFRDSIERYVELQRLYPQFHFLERRLLENIIIRTSALIENNGRTKFNILKPINRILSENNFKTKHTQIREIEAKIKMKMIEPITEMLFYVRDKYLAHNDLNNREGVDNVVPNEIRSYVEELLKLINQLCEVVDVPTSRLVKHANNSMDNIFEKLKN